MDSSASEIEKQINSFLDSLAPAIVIKTETMLTAAAEKAKDGTSPCIVVTIWYEMA
jgi:hypothetical protein